MNRREKIAWLQGFYDGEGGAYFKKFVYPTPHYTCHTHRIHLSNTSKKLIDLTSKFLNDLDIKHTIEFKDRSKIKTKKGNSYKNLYIINVCGKRCIKFRTLINFRELRKQKILDEICKWVNRPKIYEPKYGRDRLYYLYIEKQFSAPQIAKILKIKSGGESIRLMLKRCNIPRRSHTENMKFRKRDLRGRMLSL